MDNFKLDLTNQGDDALRTAMSLFATIASKVVGYSIEGGTRLVFYWYESPKCTPLPFPMTLRQAADFAIGWLNHVDYGRAPSHDGDNEKGWRVFCEEWGSVGHDQYAFIAVEPVWAIHSK